MEQGFATRAIHAGYRPDQQRFRPLVQPVVNAATYQCLSLLENEGCSYARTGNPNRNNLETTLASLEGGRYGVCFSSGMAALTASVLLLEPGDHIICSHELYGGTQYLLEKHVPRLRIEVDFVDLTQDHEEMLKKHLKPRTKMILTESLTNPNLRLIDIESISTAVKKFRPDLILVVDNTFLSPYLLKPLQLEVCIVVHSLTKYINGHGDVIMGGAITNDETIFKRLKDIQGAMGAIPSPPDTVLVARGIKTLSLRMARHCSSAMTVATFLQSHPAVEIVRYPGLDSYPQRKLARRMLKEFGGMVAFSLKSSLGQEGVEKLVAKLRLVILTGSLGMAETTIQHPATLSHRQVSPAIRREAEIHDTLLRLSVGLEDPEDIVADLKQALDSLH